jgi:ribose-phosphate pyrophosphokinase
VLNEITIFSGLAHPQLAHAICAELGVELSPARVERFSNDCLGVHLDANCRERDVFVIQPLASPVQERLMELLLMLDAARGASAARITAVIPYYAYARSDKKDAPRISIAARLVADLLVAAGVDRVLTMALHSPQVHGFFSVPVDHLNALGVLAEEFRGRDLSATTVVSPDLGNAKSASEFARLIGVPVAAGQKRRISDREVVIDTIVGEVAGRDIILLDDEISSGGTIVAMLRLLAERGARAVSVTCTHGVFSPSALGRILGEPNARELIATDTLPLPPGERPATMRVASIAPLMAEAIRRIHIGESVSSLFAV